MKRYTRKAAQFFSLSFLNGKVLQSFLWLGKVHIIFSQYALSKISTTRASFFQGRKRYLRKLLGVVITIVLWFPYVLIAALLFCISKVFQGMIVLLWGKVIDLSIKSTTTSSIQQGKSTPMPVIKEYIPQEEVVTDTEKLILELMHFPKDQNNILFSHNRVIDEEFREREYALKRREETQQEELLDVRRMRRELEVEKEMLQLEKKKLEILSMQSASEPDRMEQLRQLKLEEEIIKKRRENERGW